MSVLELERTATQQEVLSQAAEILEEGEFTNGSKGMYEKGPMCYFGAVAQAMRDLLGMEGYIASHNVRAYLRLSREEMADIWRWNDVVGRTKEEVVARLRKAAEAA